jgi:hypothetical protein
VARPPGGPPESGERPARGVAIGPHYLAARHGPEFARRPGSATVLNAHLTGRTRPDGRAPHADVAQLVEHHLAKVRVAGSNPVVRSEAPDSVPQAQARTVLRMSKAMIPPAGNVGAGGVAEWLRQGPAKPCTRVRFPPPPRGAVSSAWYERCLDTAEVAGSNPARPTTASEPAGCW